MTELETEAINAMATAFAGFRVLIEEDGCTVEQVVAYLHNSPDVIERCDAPVH